MAIFSMFYKPKSSLRAVVDIGSHSLKLAAFEVRAPEHRLSPLKKISVRLPERCQPRRMVLKFRELIFAGVKELKKIPEKITVGLGPELAELALTTWKMKLGEDQVVGPKDYTLYFNNLFEERRDKSLTALAYPLEVSINGYPLNNPKVNIRAEGELAFRLMLISIPAGIGEILTRTRSALGGIPIEFVPLAAAETLALGRMGDARDFLGIDIGGENTTTFLVKNGMLGGIAFFPLGTHHFSRGIARISGIPFHEAEDIGRQYAQEIIGEPKKMELRNFMLQELKLWEKGFLESLDSFYTVGPIPSRVFLLGGGARLREADEWLRKSGWMEDRSWAARPEVSIARAEGFFEGRTFGGFLKGPEETGLASLAIYSLHHEPLW